MGSPAYCRGSRWCRRKRPRRSRPTHVPDTFILVDPLDGTREFIAGRDEFTVNIAIVHDGRPVSGIVGTPALDTIWRGALNTGAERLQLACGAHPRDATEPCSPSHIRAQGRDLARDGEPVACRPHDRAMAQAVSRDRAHGLRIVGEILPDRRRRGRCLSEARAHLGMGHCGGRCRAQRRRRDRADAGRRTASLRTGRTQSQSAVFRRLGRCRGRGEISG